MCGCVCVCALARAVYFVFKVLGLLRFEAETGLKLKIPCLSFLMELQLCTTTEGLLPAYNDRKRIYTICLGCEMLMFWSFCFEMVRDITDLEFMTVLPQPPKC